MSTNPLSDEWRCATGPSEDFLIPSVPPPRGTNVAPDVVALLAGKQVKALLHEQAAARPEAARRSVVVLSPHDSVDAALRKLADHNLLSAPVRDPEEAAFLGFVDVLDLVSFVVAPPASETTTTTAAAATAKARDDAVAAVAAYWETLAGAGGEAKLEAFARAKLEQTTVGAVVNASRRDPFLPISQSATLHQVVEDVFRNGVHRAPVFDDDGHLLAVLTQSDIVRFLAREVQSIDASASRSLEELGLIKAEPRPPLVSASFDERAVVAFARMRAHGVSAVAVVDRDGTLLANLSASDLRGVTRAGFASLLLPVFPFLPRQQEALGRVPATPMTCHTFTPLRSALLRLGMFRYHRLWVVDANYVATHVLTLSDLLAWIASS